MNNKIVLITDSFPFIPGEEFLETELSYWEKRDDIKLTIMPKMSTTKVRDIPQDIHLDMRLDIKTISKQTQLYYLFKMLITPIFYKELNFQLVKTPLALKNIVRSMFYFLFFKERLKVYLQAHQDEKILFYTYWNTEATYALQFLKKEFKNIKIVSRIHGYDLYQERRDANYMPLKKQFLQGLDKLYAISDKAKIYLDNIYGFNKNIVSVSRLGVKDLNIICNSTDNKTLHIASCSYLVNLKRVDKIIDAIYELSAKKVYEKIVWKHIGDGILKEELLEYASKKFVDTSIDYEFLGHIENKKIYEFYKNNQIDVFINVSQSEGVPVSIMEAMSCSIPVIAPDIGGISEMIVDGYNGILLTKECSIEEIVKALSKKEFFKALEIRDNSYKVYQEKYNAETNYSNFIKSIQEVQNNV